MSLSFKSGTYQEIYRDIGNLKKEKGQVTREDIIALAQSKGTTYEDVISATREFKNMQAEAEKFADMYDQQGTMTDDQRQQIIDFYILGPQTGQGPQQRMFRRALGSTADAVGFLSEAFLPEKVVDKTAETYQQYIPKSVKQELSAFIDPYHGEGLVAGIEEVGGELASYALPMTGFVKAGKLVASTPQAAAQLSKLGKKGRLFAKAGGYGVAYAAGATVIDDPRISTFDSIKAAVFEDPAAMERLKKLAENPDDVEASDYLTAFIENLAFEGLGGAGVHSAGSLAKALGRSYKTGSLSKVKNVATKIGDTTRGATQPYISTLAEMTEKPRRRVGQYFSSRMGTDDNFISALLKRETADEASVVRADGMAADLQKSIDENLPERFKTEEFYRDVINEALAGNKKRLDDLRVISPKVADNVDILRNEIDTLSKKLPIEAGNLRAIIDNNLGIYLNRSYEIFDNPEYKKIIAERVLKRPENKAKIREIRLGQAKGMYSKQEADALIDGLTDDVVENAADFIGKQRGLPANAPEVQETLEKLVKAEDAETFANFIASISNKNRYASSSKPLLKRSDLDVSIRDLMGEVKDPKKNFINTYVKLSKMNAEAEFLNEVAGQLSIKFQNRVKKIMDRNPNLTYAEATKEAQKGLVDVSSGIGADKKLSWIFEGAKTGDVKNPMQFVYADKAYVDAINKGFDVSLDSIGNNILRNGLQAFAGAKGASQFAKTVLNVPTHGKNMIGNVAMLTANGIFPNKAALNKAIQTTAAQLRNKNNTELGEQLAEYIQLGVTNSGVGLGIVRRNLNEAFKNSDGYINKVTALRRGKEGLKKIADVYQAEDDFFKIIHFEKTKETLKKVYPDFSEEQIKQMAAQRTRDMMPNYRLVPKAFKAMGYSPFGDFVAFPMEMLRTSKNMAKYTMQDLKNVAFSGDENVNKQELLKYAGSRLAGMTAVGTVPTVLNNVTRSAAGISEEQDEAISLLGPSYYRLQDKIYLDGFSVDNNGHVSAPVTYIGAYDPYNMLKVMARGVHTALLEGEDLNEEQLFRLGIGVAEQTFYPIVGPSMLTEAMGDVFNKITGKESYSAEPSQGVLADSLSTVVDLFDPGYKRFLDRRKDYERSGMSDNFYSISEGDVDMAAFLGFRRTNIDLSAGIGQNVIGPMSRIRKADGRLKSVIQNPNSTSEDIYNEYVEAQKRRSEGFKELRGVIELYKDAGYTVEGLIDDVDLEGRKRGFTPEERELIAYANENKFLPSQVRPKKTFAGPVAEIPYQQIEELYGQLLNQRIE